jgi:hypothetical protein
MHEPQFDKKVNVEPLLELLSKNHDKDYADYIDEAIKWLLSSGIETETNFMEEAYNLYAVRDMFLEMAQSSKVGN